VRSRLGTRRGEPRRIGGDERHLETPRIEVRHDLDRDLSATAFAIASQLHHAYASRRDHRESLRPFVTPTPCGRTAGKAMLSWNLVVVFHHEATRPVAQRGAITISTSTHSASVANFSGHSALISAGSSR